MVSQLARCDAEIARIMVELGTDHGLGEMHGKLLGLCDWSNERRFLMHSFQSGAKSSEVKPRYDLVPLVAITYIAERFGYGADTHGEWNWQNGSNDPEFIRDRKNHAVAHLMNYVNGVETTEDSVKDHLKAALCNLAMLAWLEEHGRESNKQVLQSQPS